MKEEERKKQVYIDESQSYAHSLITIHLCIEMRMKKQDHCSDFSCYCTHVCDLAYSFAPCGPL